MPFIAENLWQRVSGLNFTDSNRSVHLEKWPEFTAPAKSMFKKLFTKKSARNHQLVIEQMDVVRRLVEIGLAKRDEAGLKIRQKLNRLTVTGKVDLPAEYIGLITDELNINEVVVIPSDADKLSAELDTTITPALRQEGIKRELIRSLNLWRKDNNLQINDRVAAVYEAPEELRSIIEAVKAEIIKDTLLSDLSFGPVAGADQKEIKIDGQIVKFCLQTN
jgi:isoleucyl-tRNA synthetase